MATNDIVRNGIEKILGLGAKLLVVTPEEH